MLNFGNKEFRNLQEQVLKNANDIEKLHELTGGVIGVEGPKGDTGATGPAGAKGERGSVWTVGTNFPLDAKEGDCHLKDSYVYQYKNNQWMPYGSIKGTQGTQGAMGPRGEQGIQGPQGIQGVQGPQGEQFLIYGPVLNITQLPDPTTQTRNTAYLVGSAAPYTLYAISDSGNGLVWVNVGSFATLDNIRTIIIDAPESATSGTLTVDQVNLLKDNDCVLQLGYDIYHKTEDQEADGYWVYSSFNNVYISVITIMTAGSWTKTTYRNNFVPDEELSITSSNPVQNKAITEKFNSIIEDNLIWGQDNYSFNVSSEQHPIIYSTNVEAGEKLSLIVKGVNRDTTFAFQVYFYDNQNTQLTVQDKWIENGDYNFLITVPENAVKISIGYWINGTGSYSSAVLYRGLTEEHVIKLNEDIKVHVEDIHPEQTNFIKGKLIYSGSAKTSITTSSGQLLLKEKIYDFKSNTSYNCIFSMVKNNNDILPYISLRFYKADGNIVYHDLYPFYFPNTFTSPESFEYVDIYGVWYSQSGSTESIEAELSLEDILIYEANGTTLPYVFSDLLTKDRYVHDHRLKTLYLNGDITNMDKDNYVTLSYMYEYAPDSVWHGILECKWQGSSSLNYPKKNFTIKFATERTIKEAWGPQKKYVLKADWVDSSHARNNVGALLWGDVYRTRTEKNATLEALPNCGAIDGFPIQVVLNGEWIGIYNFNIPKDGWMMGMGNGAIVCAENFAWEKDPLLDENVLSLEYKSDNYTEQEIYDSLNRIKTIVYDNRDSLTSDNIDEILGPYLDIDSTIDYILFNSCMAGEDNGVRNWLLGTYDNIKWFFVPYDMDMTFGRYPWYNTPFREPFTQLYNPGYVFTLMKALLPERVKARWEVLKQGPLSPGNVITRFANFMGLIPLSAYIEEDKKWQPTIQDHSLTSTNNLSQISTWYMLTFDILDKYIQNYK